MTRPFAALLLASARLALAQDDLIRVASPNGQIEFQLFVATPPESGSLPRLGYQVYFKGKRIMDPSFLGFDIHNQEPFLGEKIGLMSSKTVPGRFNSLTAEYMQNGSLGRRLNIEIRAFNEGVAFRYVIPWSSPLEEILIENEVTEFSFAEDGELTRIPPGSPIPLPFFCEQPGIGWVEITETHLKDYPPMHLERYQGRILNSRLARPADPLKFAVEGKTPMNSPWRVLVIGSARAELVDSKILSSLLE